MLLNILANGIKVLMLHGVLGPDALVPVVLEHLVQEVDGVGWTGRLVLLGDECFPWYLWIILLRQNLAHFNWNAKAILLAICVQFLLA